MRIGSLFAGIGGFDLAASWCGWETAWYSEIDPYASAVMAKHFPQAVNHGDITKIDGHSVEHVDLLCGGFPCQDISLAGKGAGLAGERSGLWSHYARLIDEIRPAWVVIENVSALRSRGLDVVLGEIAALGYDAEWHCIPASAVGAPHRRDRVWLVADSNRDNGGPWRSGRSDPSSPRQRITQRAFQDVADADGGRLEVGAELDGGTAQDSSDGDSRRGHVDGPRSAGWWLTEPHICRVANGVPSRVDRLKCLGNAIVPQVAYEIFKRIQLTEMK